MYLYSPYEVYCNPLETESIIVKKSIQLDANHSLVVYKQHDEHIERRIITGPTVFMPGPQEWCVILKCNVYVTYILLDITHFCIIYTSYIVYTHNLCIMDIMYDVLYGFSSTTY